MELFVIIVNGFQLLTIIAKSFILDVAAVLDPPLIMASLISKDYIAVVFKGTFKTFSVLLFIMTSLFNSLHKN